MLVGDLLKDGVFPDFRLIAGSDGLTRRIKTVTVMDAPDADRWMRGGELVIGSAYVFKEDPERLTSFVRQLDAKGVSAVGIKIDRFLSAFPESLICEANESRIPLLQIPLRYAWSDIIDVVQSRMWAQKTRSGKPEDDLVSFPWDDDWDVRRVFSSFAANFGKDIFVFAPSLKIDQCFPADGKVLNDGEASALLDAPSLRDVDLPQRGAVRVFLEERFFEGRALWFACYSLRQEVEIDVLICLHEGEYAPSIYEERSIIRAVNLLRVAGIESALFSRQTNARRERFLENLCLGAYTNEAIACERAKNLGVHISLPATVIHICSVDRAAPLGASPPLPLGYKLAEWWICVESEVSLRDKLEEYKVLAAEKKLWFALGGSATKFLGLAHSYEESRRALCWLRRFHPQPGVYRHDELTLHAFMNKVTALPEAENLWERFWQPLVATGSGRKKTVSFEDLAATLIRCDFNGKQCARELHMHYNTFRNYLAEVEDLLHIDTSNHLHRIALELSYFVDTTKKHKLWQGPL